LGGGGGVPCGWMAYCHATVLFTQPGRYGPKPGALLFAVLDPLGSNDQTYDPVPTSEWLPTALQNAVANLLPPVPSP